jgi:hypothetical protein
MSLYSLEELRRTAEVVKQEARRNREALIKEQYNSDNPKSKLDGLCYVASETMYHLTGGKEVWKPNQMEYNGVSHWFLIHKETGNVFDLTEEQFDDAVPHNAARGRGFCTKNPSRRSSLLIEKVKNRTEASDIDLNL